MTQDTREALADRDAAIRIWHKHCGKFEAVVGSHPASCEIDAMLEFAALSSQPPAPSEDDLVMVPRGLIGAACAAITKKHDAPKTLEQLRRYTAGDLS